MSINIQDGQRVSVWSVEDKGNYSLIQMSTGRKDKRTDEYVNSSWGFVRFVGKAHEKADDLERGDRIELKGATISREPYEKDGETLYPKNPTITVFNFDWLEEKDEKPKSKPKKNSKKNDDDWEDEDLPF